jgi:hypothetical protein
MGRVRRGGRAVRKRKLETMATASAPSPRPFYEGLKDKGP